MDTSRCGAALRPASCCSRDSRELERFFFFFLRKQTAETSPLLKQLCVLQLKNKKKSSSGARLTLKSNRRNSLLSWSCQEWAMQGDGSEGHGSPAGTRCLEALSHFPLHLEMCRTQLGAAALGQRISSGEGQSRPW